ncbi:MAG: hypothetical protein L0Y76_06865 [Ignavibacteria bacterium]|nr:hypothetical protein [Ignavibacteria bacterium]
MNKTIFLLWVFAGLFWVNIVYSQGYTPPNITLGGSLDGILATNDAHGSNLDNTNTITDTYGMVWGRGLTLHGKFGLGVRKNHRITVATSYQKMVHDQSGEVPFFNFSPEEPYTNYDLFVGAVGYEYAFNPRCKNKQYLGIAFTTNLISPGSGIVSAYDFENSWRIGMQFSMGYEWTLGKAQETGLFVGLKYNLANIIGTTNGEGTMNDGSDPPGPTFWRRVGFLSLNFGFNFYTGVKPYRAK